MKLREYLALNELTYAAFAKELYVTPITIAYLCQGRRHASPELALEIERFTKGEVRAIELIRPPKIREFCLHCGHLIRTKTQRKDCKNSKDLLR